MEEKRKCKICGKVGLSKDVKGLRRHLRLGHNNCIPKEFNVEDYFEPVDIDAVVEIFSGTRKAYRKQKNKKWTKWQRGLGGTKSFKSPHAKIIYTPMGNKR